MINFKSLVLDKYFEPALGRSVRVTTGLVLPLIWGILTHNMEAAVWIAISAQTLSFINIEGSYPIKLLMISGAILACGISGVLGVLFGTGWLPATIFMFLLGFLGGYVRQSGSHGPGITISVLLMYLLCLDHPDGYEYAGKMFLWILGGGLIALALILFSWIFIPYSPFRRSVSYTWKAMSDWLALFPDIIKAKTASEYEDKLDEKELAFREELSNSMDILSRKQAIAHSRQNKLSFQIVEFRRIVSYINPAVSALQDAIENIKQQEGFPDKLLIYITENLAQAARRVAISIISNHPEDVYAVKLSIKRIKNNTELLHSDMPDAANPVYKHQIIEAINEIISYLEEAVVILDKTSSKSRSVVFFMRNFFTGMTIPQKIPLVRIQLNFKSFTFRFSLRLALAMAISIIIYKIFKIPHGYWIAMTAMIVLQPEFGATFTKASRRIKGTVSGAVIGAFIFLYPLPLPAGIALVVIASFLMAYYVQHNYAVAAFFITVMVIALYHLIEPSSWQVGIIRVFNTIGGAGLALLGGYAFFPLWERYRIPALLEKAIQSNRNYLDALLSMGKKHLRTKMDYVGPRREAEVNNSNAFQSLRRMKEEPVQKQSNHESYYIITGYNIRLTRLLKTLNQQLLKEPDIHLSYPENLKIKLTEVLDCAAAIVAGEDIKSATAHLASPDKLIREIDGLLNESNKDNTADAVAFRILFDRIVKEVMGLYYTILQAKTDREKTKPAV